MKIIVGLGNPGAEYKNTRHNAGFMFLEKMSDGENFSLDKKFEADVCKAKEFIFVKPQTFMNDSGRAVRKVMDFYKLNTSDLVLVHDDLDLKLGEYKIQMGIGPKVHNGVTSVEQCMPDKNFLRVRLGVDGREDSFFEGSGADYILGKFAKTEMETLEDMIEEAVDELPVALGLEEE
jgi:PTH1 family peptidyl-tRNA hydrolase